MAARAKGAIEMRKKAKAYFRTAREPAAGAEAAFQDARASVRLKPFFLRNWRALHSFRPALSARFSASPAFPAFAASASPALTGASAFGRPDAAGFGGRAFSLA